MFVNSLSLNDIKDAIKLVRGQLIYVVFAIVLGILIYNRLFFLTPLLAFFYLRFKNVWYVFVFITFASLIILHISTQPPQSFEISNEQTYYTASVIRVQRRLDERQTAIVEIDGNRVFMTYRSTYPVLIPGQTIEVFGRLSQPSTPTVPYRFDFSSFLANQNIFLTMHTSNLEVTHTAFSFWRIQYDLSVFIRDRFTPMTASYLLSFFLGVRDDMDEDMMSIYGDLGILHVFAISGVHVALLTGIVRDFLKRIGLIDIIVDAITILFCVAFVFATGGSVSIIRASSMSILGILNRRFSWKLSSFDVFAVVFIANFIVNPLIVYQSGFQFSYLISFVLICAKPSMKNLTPFWSRLTVVYLARMASIPLSVASGYEINLTSYFANLLLVPILMQLIIPTLLVTLFLPVISPVSEFMLTSFEYLNNFLLPYLNTNVTFGSISLAQVVLLLTLLIVSCFFFERKQKIIIRILLIVAYGVVLEVNRFSPYSVVTFLDVGQGDATIIRSPNQACTIVIDTGGDVSRIRSADPSIFSNTLEPYLLGNGVRNIDFLILTHEHYDHIAEAVNLMNRFNVRNLIISEATLFHQMQAIVDEAYLLDIPVHTARPHDVFECANQRYTFIHPPIDNLDANEDSLVMTVEVDGFNVLITGDIGHVSESQILANNHLPHIDFYQVAHHGSRYSNSLEFMEALNIRYAIVPVGTRNFYNHPHQELFDVTDALNIPLLDTSVHGTVSFRLRRGTYRIYIWPHPRN